MRTDPALRQISNDLWDNGKDMIEIGRRIGFHTNADAAKILKDHPHYIPEVDVAGQLMHVMGERDISRATGVRQVNTIPWQAAQQHVESLFKDYMKNDFNAKAMDSLVRAQNAEPTAAKIITPAALPPHALNNPFYSGTAAIDTGRYREPVVIIRTDAGPKAWRVAHPDMFNMFTGDSLKKQHIAAEAATIPRRLYQWATTGPGSLVTGSVNALRNATYGQMLIPVNSPKGAYAGLIHKGVTKATGGRWDSGVARGLDVLTTPAVSTYAYGRGVVDRQAFRTAKWLEPGANNPVNSLFRSTIGDAATDAMHQSLNKYYHDTFTAELARRGAGNTGLPAKADLPSLNIEANKAATYAAAQSVPKAFYGKQWYGSKPYLLKLNQAVGEALGHISDAGNEGWARLNENNPNMRQAQKTIETRRLMGDPGVSGGSQILRGISSVLPYANISVQGTARLGRSLGERPVNAPLAIATGLGTLALIQQLTAMRSPAHMAHYQNALSNQQHEANFQFYTDEDPSKYTAVPVPQELRPIKALMDQLVAHATNIIAQQHDPLTFHSVEQMILDFLGSHISNATWDQVKRGVADITEVANLPPLLGHVDQYKLMQGAGLAEATTSPWAGSGVPSNRLAPNQAPEGALDSKDGQMWTKVMGAVFGLGGTVLDAGNNVSRYAHQAGGGLDGWIKGLGKGGRDWLFNAAEKNPEFNMVLEHQMRSSLQPPIVERTERELKWMKDITGSRTAPAAEGFTGRNRSALEVYPTQEQKIPKDPTMLFLWQTIEGGNRSVAQAQADVSALRKQMASVGNEGLDPATKRAWMNDATRRLADKYRFMHDVVEDTNHTMTKALGRPVRVGMSIDWQKGPEQFD